MLLTIAVRHATTVLGLYLGSGQHAKLVRHWRIHTEPRATADELAVHVRALLGGNADDLTGIAALSTAPAALHELRAMLTNHFGNLPHVLIEPGVRTGMALLVDNPKEVGADRIANCLAAHSLYQKPAIVVDFGTAICVDLVSGKGEFLGGVIAPGVEVSTDALYRNAVLRKAELARPRSVLGKNTVECLQSGAVFGFAGMVDGLVDRIRDEFDDFAGDDVAIIATGDAASLILPETETLEHHEPHLTLTGLRLVHELGGRASSRAWASRR